MYKSDKIKWIVDQHESTNHKYDNYLPYEFHLRMVVQVFNEFKNLLPGMLFTHEEEVHRGSWETYDDTLKVVELACWGHDLLEDTRVSYNDIKNRLDMYGNYNVPYISDIIYAVTNEKGKTRKERANDKYYEGIRNTPGAVFVKLCDRIANVRYSKMTKGSMFEKYKKENEEFITQLGYSGQPSQLYFPMFYELNKLFKDD
jgi:(p)ppGpp synthase/HD superfamily hydrolase